MKGNRILFLAVEAICIVIILFCGFMMLAGDRFSKTYRIYAILDNLEGEERQSFKAGLINAAEEHNIELVIAGTGESIDTNDPEKIILRERENPGLDKGLGVNFIEPDNHALGSAIGSLILKAFQDNIEGKNIAIICQNLLSESPALRIEGIKETLNQKGAENIYIIKTDDILGNNPEETIRKRPVDIVAAIDNKSLLFAGDFSSHADEPLFVCGIGNSAESVYLLEKEIINGIVFLDEYRAGYKSVEAALNKLEKSGAGSSETEYKIITNENLYSPENEAILLILSR